MARGDAQSRPGAQPARKKAPAGAFEHTTGIHDLLEFATNTHAYRSLVVRVRRCHVVDRRDGVLASQVSTRRGLADAGRADPRAFRQECSLPMRKTAGRTQSPWASRDFFIEKVSREPLLFLLAKRMAFLRYALFFNRLFKYLTSREAARNVAKGRVCTKKKQAVKKAAVSFTQHGLKSKISH
jgi:hypothetical protein